MERRLQRARNAPIRYRDEMMGWGVVRRWCLDLGVHKSVSQRVSVTAGGGGRECGGDSGWEFL